jgi:hypothetical protein
MTSPVQATAAPVPINLAGRQYMLAPLRDVDYGTFQAFIQDRIIEIAARQIGKLPPAAADALLDKAMKLAARVTASSPEAFAAMNTVDGAAMLTWLGLRGNHPDMTFEQVRTLLLDPKTMEEAMRKVDQLNAMHGAGEADPKKREGATGAETAGTSTAPSATDTAGPPSKSAA